MRRQARSASAMFDPELGRVVALVTLADGEQVTLELLCPETLLDSLQRALQRKRETTAKSDAGRWRLSPLSEN